jgi:hypothetical protein
VPHSKGKGWIDVLATVGHGVCRSLGIGQFPPAWSYLGGEQ